MSYTRINDESQKTEYGFIAQEVEDGLKESGIFNSGMITIDDNGNYEMRYNDLLAPMVKAIQELKAQNDIMKVETEKLKAENVELRNGDKEIKNRLLELEQTQNKLASELKKFQLKESIITDVGKGGEK